MLETKLPKEYSRFVNHILGTQKIAYLKERRTFRIENDQCHLFEVNSFDLKDDVRPELRTYEHSKNSHLSRSAKNK